MPEEEIRRLKYINPHGKEVWLDEETAYAFHNEIIRKGGKFVGDQHGNTEPPRDLRRELHIGDRVVRSGRSNMVAPSANPQPIVTERLEKKIKELEREIEELRKKKK